MTAALDVSYLADTVSEVGRSCAIETAERQYRGGTVSALGRATVEIVQERHDAFRTPR